MTPNITPTFSVIPAFCKGTTAPSLPLVSTNNISETWNPPTVDNQANGTYTFTPSSGACATTTSLEVTVSESLTIVLDTNVCTDDFPIIWNGQTIVDEGTYTHADLSGNSACDSTTILFVTNKLNCVPPPLRPMEAL